MLRSIEGVGLHALIARALAEPADRLAVTDSEGEFRLGEVAALVRRALAAFAALGLSPGDAVAQLSRNRARMWAVMAACYMGGYRSVTLHPLGGLEDQRFILRDCGARMLVTDANFAARGRELGAPLHLSHEPGPGCFWEIVPDDPGGGWPAAADPETVVRIAYTGGTTGRPKGVLLPARALAWNSEVALTCIDWPKVPRFLCVAPISHGSGSLVLPVLLKGGEVHLRPGFSVEDVSEAGRRWHANVTWLVPTMLKALVESPHAMPGFATIVWSGAAAGPLLLEAAQRRFGPVLVGCYGQTEAPNVITILDKAGHDPARPERLGSVGLPTPGTQVDVRDAKGRPCPPGVPGEVHVAGPLLMRGYLGMEAETARVLNDGWLATGDIGRMDADGVLTLVDRAKDMIISGGFNIYPAEVEAALLSHESVADAAVAGRPDPHWGEAAVAFVVLRAGAGADADALNAHVRARKGPVLVPKEIRFMDALPRTPLGKTDRKALRALLSQ